MVTENDPLGGHVRAFDTLEYHPFQQGYDVSWRGNAHVSYFSKDGATRTFRVLETSAPENIPLILGGIKKAYVGQSELQRHLADMQNGDLVFVHRDDMLLPVMIEGVKTKSFGQVTDEEWQSAGHKSLDTYIERLGGIGQHDEHSAVAEALTHAHATVVNFHVATASELVAKGLDPKVIADQVRQGRATLQARNPNAEDAATRFAAGSDAEAGHSFQEATGTAIANMRTTSGAIDRATALFATGVKNDDDLGGQGIEICTYR